jgi:LPS O-antigen subunit length determinant protein (WzzB/FepE family)
MTTETASRTKGNEIDLSAFFAILWRRRKLILIGTAALTLLAAVLSFLLPRVYRSTGYYQLGSANAGVSIQLYKSSSSMFTNPNRFQKAARGEAAFNQEEKKKIAEEFREQESIGSWIAPLYAFSREDQRLLAQISKDEQNAVLGLNLAYEANSPQAAARMVSFFGRFVRDCLMYVTLFNYVSDNAIDSHTSLQKNENALIENRFRFGQQEKKLLDIRAILRNYPDSARIENRQLVSIQDGGARYLSPVTQIVGIESTLADLRREVADLERDREMLLLRAEYFDMGRAEVDKSDEQGEGLFQALKANHAALFAKKNLERDTVREVYNSLNIDLLNFDRTFNRSYRFVSGPTVPDRHIKPSKRMIILLAIVLAGAFFCLLALALDWWNGHKQWIISPRQK